MDLEKLKYPIGRYQVDDKIDKAAIDKFIKEIELLPERLADAVRGLNLQQLKTPYRQEGWTVQQVVHHIADSHLNAYIRFKLALTESKPIVKPYDEKLWAQLHDVEKLPINISLTLLHALHLRWHETMKYITDDQWNNLTIFHPENKKTIRLWTLLGSYSWHGKHHVAHITRLREKMEW